MVPAPVEQIRFNQHRGAVDADAVPQAALLIVVDEVVVHVSPGGAFVEPGRRHTESPDGTVVDLQREMGRHDAVRRMRGPFAVGVRAPDTQSGYPGVVSRRPEQKRRVQYVGEDQPARGPAGATVSGQCHSFRNRQTGPSAHIDLGITRNENHVAPGGFVQRPRQFSVAANGTYAACKPVPVPFTPADRISRGVVFGAERFRAALKVRLARPARRTRRADPATRCPFNRNQVITSDVQGLPFNQSATPQ